MAAFPSTKRMCSGEALRNAIQRADMNTRNKALARGPLVWLLIASAGPFCLTARFATADDPSKGISNPRGVDATVQSTSLFSNAFLTTGVRAFGTTKAMHTAATTRKED
jgi:hypothetical protein